MNQVISEHLVPATHRIRFKRIWMTLSGCWLIATMVALSLLGMNQWLGWYGFWLEATSLGALAFLTLAGLAFGLPRRHDYAAAAARIEQRYPELDMKLMTALEIKSRPGGRPLSYLQQSVIRKAIYHSFQNPWIQIVPGWQIWFGPMLAMICLGCAIAGQMAVYRYAMPPSLSGGIKSFDEVMITDSELSVTIEPGDTEVERGTSLLVLARFKNRIPTKASVHIETPDGDSRQIAMFKSLSDPVFAARIDNVEQEFDYRVHYESQQTSTFHVGVFELPELVRADAVLEYPAYTELPSVTVQDVRRLSAVEGSTARLICQLNKPVAKASLQKGSDNPLILQPLPGPVPAYSVEIPFAESSRYELRLVDDRGRTNRVPPEFILQVLVNQQATIQLKQPVRDVQVSPLEELVTAAEVWDDFGIKQAGLTLRWAGNSEREIILGRDLPGKQKTELSHLISMEDLQAEPDQLLAYFYWSDEIGPDGEIRRTASDMFFAEVRHFEEIFRQGNQPPGGQAQPPNQEGGQNAQQAGQLAEIQKQIINATWKIIRTETGSSRSPDFIDHLETVIQSQASLIQQVEAFSGEVRDPESRQLLADVVTHMNEALRFLSRVHQTSDVEPLQDALVAEQKAYQALLKTRAREHEVVRNQAAGQPGGGNPGSRSQQQLQQLELANDENRYETQSVAQEQESAEQREDRQILNRLRELARRQNYLNERIKELQTELEKAKTEEEKEEIERQLKRLREEQQQILRDTDELRDRMNQPENQQRMSVQSQQVEQARENIRRASEALEQGQVSRAAAEGARAEDQLRELRDEFQNRSSSEFAEEMSEMRNEAREIDQNQQELAERLDELDRDETRNRSLRDTDESQQIADDMNRQRERIDNVQQQMRDTIERAETIEPLLAQELYETFRQAQQDRPGDALDSANRSLREGFIDDAGREQRRAARGIQNLREGIDRAAESVLGDETQALRRAQQELEQLSREVNQEINREDPQGDPMPTDSQPTPADQTGESLEEPSSQSDRQREGDSDAQQARPGDDEDSQARSEAQSGQGQNDSERDGQGQQGGSDVDNRQSSGDPSRSGSRQPGQSVRDPRGLGGGDPDRRLDSEPNQNPAPLTGEDFLDWSDRMRDVEEMIADPELRAEAARIRDRAKAIRKDLKRHSEEPNWDLVRLQIAQPLVELKRHVREEILRRSDKQSLVPIDREPVPIQFEEAVRRYYEQLGTGR